MTKAAAQQQHSSSTAAAAAAVAAVAAAAAAAARQQQRSAPLRSLGLAAVFVSVAECVCYFCVCASWLSLRGFGLGIKLGACRPIVWTAGARMNLERSSVLIVHPSGKFRAVFLSSSFNLVPSGGFLE